MSQTYQSFGLQTGDQKSEESSKSQENHRFRAEGEQANFDHNFVEQTSQNLNRRFEHRKEQPDQRGG
jgi:hypothetical protein